MPDLASDIRHYYDSLTEPITEAELRARRAAPAPDTRTHRPVVIVAVAALIGLLVVGGALIAGRVLIDGSPSEPVSPPDGYEYSGAEWVGFEFAYPGEGTDLREIEAPTLLDLSRFPFAEYTLVHLEGIVDGRFVDVVWVSHQTGHGSVVRDALVVSSATTNPRLDIWCVATVDGQDPEPRAAVLFEGGAPLRAWTFHALTPPHIAQIDPAVTSCDG
jgi:hypothetical protein